MASSESEDSLQGENELFFEWRFLFFNKKIYDYH